MHSGDAQDQLRLLHVYVLQQQDPQQLPIDSKAVDDTQKPDKLEILENTKMMLLPQQTHSSTKQ